MNTLDQLLINALNAHKAGDHQKAESLYKKVLETNPKDDIALYTYGVLCIQMGKDDEALNLILKAVQIAPAADRYKNLADLYLKKGMKAEAVECYQKALKLDPYDPLLLYKIGLIFLQENLPNEAIQSLKIAFELMPDNHEINYVYAIALHNSNDLDKAMIHYQKAIDSDFNRGQAYLGIGQIYYYKKEFDKALEFYNRAEELNPNDMSIYNSIGNCYYDLANYSESVKNYHKAFEIDPNDMSLQYNYGRALIANGDFEKGWVYFDDSRIAIYGHHNLRFPSSIKPKWNGESLENKTIYVYSSAGIGDDIMFVRYLPELYKRGAKVIARPRKEIVDLLRQSNVKAEIIDDSVADADLVFDLQIPFMSLGRAFNSIPGTIPNKEGYLKANPDKIKEFKEKYFNNNLFKLGIVWRCQDPDRSADLRFFKNIAKTKGIQIYSLQKEFGEQELSELQKDMGIIDLKEEINDFCDTASLAANMELCISIDTSVLHLIGALGIPAWGLIRFSPYWGWANGNHWYNSVKLFRQEHLDRWEEAFAKMEEELIEKVNRI